jgi:hypothetical protein
VKDLPVTQNRYPHITVFSKNLQPRFSNELLEEAFRVNVKKQVYKVDVRLNNKNTYAVVINVNQKLELECIADEYFV